MSTISGRRKEATAVVKLSKGKGVVTVNKKSIDDFNMSKDRYRPPGEQAKGKASQAL